MPETYPWYPFLPRPVASIHNRNTSAQSDNNGDASARYCDSGIAYAWPYDDGDASARSCNNGDASAGPYNNRDVSACSYNNEDASARPYDDTGGVWLPHTS